MGTALNVQIAFGRVDIIAVLCVFYAFNCWEFLSSPRSLWVFFFSLITWEFNSGMVP